MSITTKQFAFLLKHKIIKRNMPIKVAVKRTVKVSETYKVPKVYSNKGLIENIYNDEPNDTYRILYVNPEAPNKYNVCDLSQIAEIDGQDLTRYYQSFIDLLANANPTEITEQTNVAKSVLGKSEAEIGKYELYEGMKLILRNDKDSKYNNRILNVRGVGDKIRLMLNAGRPKKERK